MALFGKKKKEEKKISPEEERKQEVAEFLTRYKHKIENEFKTELTEDLGIKESRTKEYEEFKEEYMPTHMDWYAKACNFSENILKISPDAKKVPEYEEAIRICHINVTPAGVASFAFLGPIVVILLGSIFSFMMFQSTFLIMFFFAIGGLMIMPLQNAPMTMANGWKMKASNQMVLSIFYVVTYMRHTSNIERAIEFASDHLAPPLSIDLKKVVWDVETGKYESVKQSLDSYLDTWKKWNMEFIEAFHLVESSLYEGSEDRRIAMLDKALSVMLDETYEKMLHYAQNLNSPITMLHMLGVIMPILGLVILPLMVAFMCEVKWYHLMAIYNIALPIGVYYLGRSILSTRPTGYGDTDISETNPEMKKYKNLIINVAGTEIKISPVVVGIIVGIVLFLIGISPVLLRPFVAESHFDVIVNGKPSMDESIIAVTTQVDDPRAMFSFFGYKESVGCPAGEAGAGDIVGPFGLGASLISLVAILGIAFGFGLYFKYKASNLLEIRERSKKLEKEFASALFQLGNRLGDGLPAEISFTKVADVLEGTASGDFFRMVSNNITSMGMSVEEAIFDPHHGALIHYPSALIESSMKVLIESVKKGPLIAAQALVSVSTYIKEIHRVDERLKDLMSETISSMKSQLKYMTPVIAGIVIGITSMITTILGKLTTQLKSVTKGVEGGGMEGVGGADLISMFGDGVPTFYFQMVVGLYVVQIIYILTILSSGIEEGADKLNERYQLGKNLITSTTYYCGISLIIMLLFNIVAGSIISSIKMGG